ncbi:C3H1-type domain-containing protein, partial [Pseudozyma hubeiensis]
MVCLDGLARLFALILPNTMNPSAESFNPTRYWDNVHTQLLPVPTFAAARYQHSGAPAESDLGVTNGTQHPQSDIRCASQRLEEGEAIQRLSQLSLSTIGSPPQHLPPPELSWPQGELGFHHDWSLSSSSASDASSRSTTRASTHHGLNFNFGPSAWPNFPSWNVCAPATHGIAAIAPFHKAISPTLGFSPMDQAAQSIASFQPHPSNLDLGPSTDFNQTSNLLREHQLLKHQTTITYQNPFGTSN